MFRKILIANRAEIACRVIKTCRRMGIATVAVYSDADSRALHVEMADEKINIGPPPAAQSYLAIDRILEACRQTGADAVHPGYGFLSEQAAFPNALTAAGIAFIGPNAGAIEAMGDKIESKRRAAAAGVSTIPGYPGVVADAAEAARIAAEIGYPVMIKASAGGGGKGMRIAHSPAELKDGFTRAQSEAEASFGDGRLLLEKYIVNPRHIEIQVLGDRHGNVIHLGERECSIQRRNQKVIEEAPSPLLDERTRAAMGAEAVAIAKAVGYDSAGTVEFVADQACIFYFLEMNTRLQVEHPVTELVTGIDLVEHMIRIAAGERLSLRQADVRLDGWAIESRIYAEDPSRDFLPSTGRLIRYRPPPEQSSRGIAVRIDTGVAEGCEISIWYDPLIAKLATHAPTRAQAIEAMAAALDRFYLDGTRHNIAFLAAVMANRRWREGALSTGFIAEEFPQGFHGVAPAPGHARRLAEIACLLDHLHRRRRFKIGKDMVGRESRLPATRLVRLGKDWHRFEVTEEWNDRGEASGWTPGQSIFSGVIGGQPITVQLHPILNGHRIDHAGASLEAHVYGEREAELVRLVPDKPLADTSKALLCPMPGLVLLIAVSEGQAVKTGETLAIVEAMKMENVLRAERDVTVKKLVARKGDSLAVDAVIMEFL